MSTWIAHLPDGSELPSTCTYRNGLVSDWTGARCPTCQGTGLNRALEETRPGCYLLGSPQTCKSCAGTGDEHAPVWRWEE
jgi:DnaJ-class molecular chaperone